MNRLRHTLPCLEAGEGRRGRLGHRSTLSTCQCARSDGASTGVDPQKERRASAANWFWQAIISVAHAAAGHRNDAGLVERATRVERGASSKSTNKPVDVPPGREPPPPRGSGRHHTNEMKANNVLFSDLNSDPSGTQRAPAAISPATQLAAIA